MSEAGLSANDVDFEAFYQGKPAIEGTAVSFDVAPWDIGEAQPAVVALAESGALGGNVLDVGCGPGDNAIFLAGRGHRVTGVDGSETALAKARQRAAEHGVDVDFVRDDATTLDGVPEGMDTVLDSALYHCLSGEQRSAYAAALHRVTEPGAALHLFCFADGAQGLQVPMVVSQDDLRENLGAHWDIRSIEPTDYTAALTLDLLDQVDQEQLNKAGFAIDRDTVRTDQHGRILGHVWHLHAERR